MPQIQAGETFAVGQQFTATRANNHVNGAIVLKGVVTEQVVPGVTIVPSDIVVLGYSTIRDRLEKVNVNSILNSAVNISATGNISSGGTVSGSEFTFGDGITLICNLNGAGFSVTAPDSEFLVDSFDVQAGGANGISMTSSSGPTVLVNTWTDPLNTPTFNNGNIIVEGDVDFTNSKFLFNGKDKIPKILAQQAYDEEIVLRNNILCERGVAGVINVTQGNFLAAVPAGPTNLYTEAITVPAGEKWIVEFNLFLLWGSSDDNFFFGWFLDNVIQQYHASFVYNQSYYQDFSYKLTIDNTAGTSSVTRTVHFRGAPISGVGGDWFIMGEYKGFTTHPDLNWQAGTLKNYHLGNKWSRRISKFRN